jgi:preprotein translocase subunit YajC
LARVGYENARLAPLSMESRLFISPAFAQGAPGGDVMTAVTQFLPFILIFVIMWFLIIRPQQRRVRAHQEMIKNVRRGDTVVTSGGIIGKVTKVLEGHDLRGPLQERAREGLMNKAGPRPAGDWFAAVSAAG